MKTLLLSLLLVLSFNSFSQFEVTETKEEVVIWQNLKSTRLVQFFREDGSKHYTLYFRNNMYQAITDIKYISFSKKEELIQFFELCRKAYADKSKSTIRTPIYHLTKSILKQVEVYNDNGAYFYLLLKDVTKMETKLKEKDSE